MFSANPKHIDGLVDAGLDWVSLANNHIGDAGRKRGCSRRGRTWTATASRTGAGQERRRAHKASLLKAGDVTVGILGYDQIATYYTSGADTPGSARMTTKAFSRRTSRRRARRAPTS